MSSSSRASSRRRSVGKQSAAKSRRADWYARRISNAGRVAAHAEQREVVGLGDELPARAHALAIDREVGLADERGRLVGDLGLGAARGREPEHAQAPRERQHVGDVDAGGARDLREVGLAVERGERGALLGREVAEVDDAAEPLAIGDLDHRRRRADQPLERRAIELAADALEDQRRGMARQPDALGRRRSARCVMW